MEERADAVAVIEFRHGDDHGDDARGDRAEGVEEKTALPAPLAGPQPAADHAELGDREGGENADRVKVQQVVDDTVENNDQGDGGQGQQDDAVGVGQPIAQVRELPRQEVVAGQHRSQLREPREGGVRGQHEHGGGGGLDHEEHPVQGGRPGRGGDLPDHALIITLGGVQVIVDAEVDRQERDAQEHGHGQTAHPDGRQGGVLVTRLGKLRRGVGDGLDAGQRGTALGECLQHHIQPDSLQACFCGGEAVTDVDRLRRMRGVCRRRDQTGDDGRQDRGDEQ